MAEKNKYIKKTLDMYSALLDLKEEINSSDLNDCRARKSFNGRVKSMEHNWGKHVEAKCILGSGIDIKFKKILKELKSKLNSKDISKITFELEKEDIILIVNSLDKLNTKVKELNKILNIDIDNTITRLDSLRIEIESVVSPVKDRIERIIEKYPNNHLVKKLAEDYIASCLMVQMKYNRILDGIDILLEVKKSDLENNSI